MKKHTTLCRVLRVDEALHHELKIALTHSSINSEKNNSRYVFLGQTAFKGEVAKILYKYVAGSGTQLQHCLGNFFKVKILQNIYSKFLLDQYVGLEANLNKNQYQHIFIFALLGFLLENASKEVIEDFIYIHFLKNNNHFLPTNQSKKNKDYKAQCVFIHKQNGYKLKAPIITKKECGTYNGELIVLENKKITTSSTSYKYLQKKIYKKALHYISEQEEIKLVNNNEYQNKVKEREERENTEQQLQKEKKLKAYFDKRAKRSEEIKKQKEVKKQIAQEKDTKRRIAKQKSKERKQLQEKQQRLKEIGLANISASKRRILEDRGILPKKK